MAKKKKATKKNKTEDKKITKKPVVKKEPAKKQSAKKPTAKKRASKKQIAKKPTAKKQTAKKQIAKKQTRPTFIGIDLAWSDHNPSGGAVIRHGRLVAYTGSLGDDASILHFIEEHISVDCPVMVGVDAPLRVPNQEGSRRCDRELSAEWRQFEAGALPANRRILPNPRGERLVELLTQRLHFAEAAPIPRKTQDRIICEIYPHPAMVSFFGLEKTLKYKARSGRTNELRWAEFARYQNYLRSLREAKPSLRKTKELLTQTDISQLRGKALKEYEDTLDAVLCAYVTSYLWHHGPQRARVYGSVAEGHIMVPITKEMEARLAAD